jgi:carbon-monoxide dehydrogenase medium subunit
MAVFFRRLPQFQYLSPRTMDEAIRLLNEHGGTAKVFAGGTDLIPQLKRRAIVVPDFLIDLKTIPGLGALSHDKETGLRIGPLTTISAIAEAPLVRAHFPALAQAASLMASPQIRHRGTFAGNICNAVPSADSAPALLVLGASISLKGPAGERTLPLEQFFLAPHKTLLQEDEVLVSIAVPQPASNTKSLYLKLSPRHSMDLAVVGVAVAGTIDQGVCKKARIALGAVAPTPMRAYTSEAMLRGQRITLQIIEETARHTVTQCSPRIDSHRASPEYRRDMVYAMTRRALAQLFL